MDILSTSGTIEVFDSPFVLMRVLRVYFLSTPNYVIIPRKQQQLNPSLNKLAKQRVKVNTHDKYLVNPIEIEIQRRERRVVGRRG